MKPHGRKFSLDLYLFIEYALQAANEHAAKVGAPHRYPSQAAGAVDGGGRRGSSENVHSIAL